MVLTLPGISRLVILARLNAFALISVTVPGMFTDGIVLLQKAYAPIAVTPFSQSMDCLAAGQ